MIKGQKLLARLGAGSLPHCMLSCSYLRKKLLLITNRLLPLTCCPRGLFVRPICLIQIWSRRSGPSASLSSCLPLFPILSVCASAVFDFYLKRLCHTSPGGRFADKANQQIGFHWFSTEGDCRDTWHNFQHRQRGFEQDEEGETGEILKKVMKRQGGRS